MVASCDPAAPTDSRSEGLCMTSSWIRLSARDSRRSASTACTARSPSRICRHTSSRTTMRISPSSCRSVISDDQEPRQVSATAIAWSPRERSRDRSIDWIGASQSRSMLVGASNSPASGPTIRLVSASVMQRVWSSHSRRPANRPAAMRSSVGVGQAAGDVGDGQRAQRGVAVGGADQPPDHRREHRLVGHRGPVALGLGQRGEQRGPPADDPGELLALPGDRPAAPAAGERAEVQGVEPGPAAPAQRDRGDARAPAAAGCTRPSRPRRSASWIPNSIIRRISATTVEDLPRPGSPKTTRLRVGGQPAQHPLDGVAVEGAAR